MADLGEEFDATTVEPSKGNGGGPIPAGSHRVAIIKSEKKPTKKKDGAYLELVLEVLEGEHKGRRLWDRLNLWNKSQQATEIARGTMSAICHATGVMKPKDSAQLHNIPVVVGVRTKEREDKKGTYSNEIQRYESTEAAAASKAETVPAGGGDGGGEKAPWE